MSAHSIIILLYRTELDIPITAIVYISNDDDDDNDKDKDNDNDDDNKFVLLTQSGNKRGNVKIEVYLLINDLFAKILFFFVLFFFGDFFVYLSKCDRDGHYLQ